MITAIRDIKAIRGIIALFYSKDIMIIFYTKIMSYYTEVLFQRQIESNTVVGNCKWVKIKVKRLAIRFAFDHNLCHENFRKVKGDIFIVEGDIHPIKPYTFALRLFFSLILKYLHEGYKVLIESLQFNLIFWTKFIIG